MGRWDLLADPKSLQASARLIGQWWREPVDYAAQVQYFAKRSLADAIRTAIGGGTGLIAGISVAVLLPAASREPLACRIDVALFAALTAIWAVVWCWRPWPSRKGSLAFVISADVGIAATTLCGASWLTGLFGLNCLALISVYLLFFDGPKILVLHTICTWMLTVAFIAEIGSGSTTVELLLFGAKMLAAVVPLTAAMVGIQLGIWALRNDANESVTDPLTRLLNRRGLLLHFGDLLRDAAPAMEIVSVAVIDLDRFKDINDRYGHAIGDQVLIRSAQKTISAVGDSALVARVGGEEFVVVELTDHSDVAQTAERIRRAICVTGERPRITASIGVTTVPRERFTVPDADLPTLLDSIIARADQAMFEAKHDGGNTIRQT